MAETPQIDGQQIRTDATIAAQKPTSAWGRLLHHIPGISDIAYFQRRHRIEESLIAQPMRQTESPVAPVEKPAETPVPQVERPAVDAAISSILRAISPDDHEFFTEEHLTGTIKPEADAFQQNFTAKYYERIAEDKPFTPTEATKQLQREADIWFATPEGQNTAQQVAQAVVELINHTPDDALPGHDKRHLGKDLADLLRQISTEHIGGAELFMLVGALHDYGRLGEAKLYGETAGGLAGSLHPTISFEFTRQLLEPFDLPDIIRDTVLYGVLVHQGANSTLDEIPQRIQRADRVAGLMGAEAWARYLLFDVGQGNNTFKIDIENPAIAYGVPIPSDKNPQDNSIAMHAMFYLRNLYPNIGDGLLQMQEVERKAQIAAIVWLATSPDERAKLFAYEESRQNGTQTAYEAAQNELFAEKPAGYLKNRIIPQGTWDRAMEIVRDAEAADGHYNHLMSKSDTKSLQDITVELMRAPSAAQRQDVEQKAMTRLTEVTDEDARMRLKKAMELALVIQQGDDEADRQLSQAIIADDTQPIMVHTFAGLVNRLFS